MGSYLSFVPNLLFKTLDEYSLNLAKKLGVGKGGTKIAPDLP